MVQKLTKIVATISDLQCDVEHIRALHQAGVDVVRLNTAHQKQEDTLKVIQSVRAVSDKIALLLDTKGPEVRTANIETPIEVKAGDRIKIARQASEPNAFEVNYDGFIREVGVGSKVLIDDGDIGMVVVEKVDNQHLVCEIENPGKIKNRKSVNVPGVHLNLPSITPKDRDYLKFAAEHDLDFVAHSFVRSKQDVLDVQAILDEYGAKAKIIAKIENQEGVDNIDEILEVAYGVMVARGDLGIEVPAQQVPVIQKKIIHKCIEAAKPVITATQMLHTMIENPRPTRAEVSDVANAIFDGTDAVMLSGETAYGKYPLEAVKVMAEIARTVEAVKEKFRNHPIYAGSSPIRDYLCKAAINAVEALPVKAIVVDSLTGRSARILATYRVDIPVYVKAHDPRVMRQLALSYGIFADYLALPPTTSQLITQALDDLVAKNSLNPTDLIVVLAGTPGDSTGSNFIEINTVENCLRGHRRNS